MKVTGIELAINEDQRVTLSIEDARRLYEQLQRIFDPASVPYVKINPSPEQPEDFKGIHRYTAPPKYPNPIIQDPPSPREPRPGEIWCGIHKRDS